MFRSSDRVITHEDPALQGITFYAYAFPGGLLGRFIGRCIRLRVSRYACVVGRDRPALLAAASSSTATASDGGSSSSSTSVLPMLSGLKRVEVDPSGLEPDCEVHQNATMQPRLAFTFAETHKIRQRLDSTVLDTARFPQVLYEIHEESETEVRGDLYLRGFTHPLQCRKEVKLNEGVLSVSCDVRLSDYDVPLPSLWMGLFTVKPLMKVEAAIPLDVMY